MPATMTKGRIPMEVKKLSISAKRQITIPQKYLTIQAFDTDADCTVRGNELVIRPARTNTGGEFAEQILADLIARGYSGNELLERFKKAQGQVRPAVEAMLADAERAASSQSGHISYEDVFGTEDEE